MGELRQQGEEQQEHLRVQPAGAGATAGTTVRYRSPADRPSIDAFESAVAEVPHVLQAQRLFGDPDYLLRVVARDQTAFQELYDESLATLPGVQRLTSTLVMKFVVTDRPLPL
ncbi:Lrp/AsnC ligand binding domain-containing protein [Amycolatopsis pretoriensis]|uniref:Lrp/AsnC ligand binding domain-containing protein n=1 Tax=Amycolatopsis pretoriensis TaxID=218821 RepID=UPI001ABF6853|nr:Lrp/AsnC ligand binding domain-containing protein [Amycolatopsis pretoriensis]